MGGHKIFNPPLARNFLRAGPRISLGAQVPEIPVFQINLRISFHQHLIMNIKMLTLIKYNVPCTHNKLNECSTPSPTILSTDTQLHLLPCLYSSIHNQEHITTKHKQLDMQPLLVQNTYVLSRVIMLSIVKRNIRILRTNYVECCMVHICMFYTVATRYCCN